MVIRGILPGVSLGEGDEDRFGVFAVDLTDDGSHFRVGQSGLVESGGSECKLAEDGADHQGDLIGVFPHPVLQRIA